MNTAIRSLIPDSRVIHGPFKGMKYPQLTSFGSVLFPKLLGSYEKELQSLIETLCLNEYTEIVNIGCAEGYYAIGFARRITTATIFAYDINKDAVDVCICMAQENSVAERLITGSFCNIGTLRSIPFSRRALIISDCEGYEKELFTDELVQLLVNHDVLIESHSNSISQLLRKRFQHTHIIAVIESLNDLAKAGTYSFPELDRYSLPERRILLAERGPAIMEWFFMTPRTNQLRPRSA